MKTTIPQIFYSLPINYVQKKADGWHLEVKKEHLLFVISILKYHSTSQFKNLLDIVVVDQLYRKSNDVRSYNRFSISYVLTSYLFQNRIFINLFIDESDCILQSSTPLYPVSDWYEREVWDIFGIFFYGHKNLRRLLTDYGFSGHPIRKDFPLTGYEEICFEERRKRVVYKSISLNQGYRHFDFRKRWFSLNLYKN